MALPVILMLLLSAKSAQLNTAYLLPGGTTKVDRQAIAASKFCALTFDDGPDATYTPQVARILERYGVSATFFVVGSRVASRPDDVRALAAAGHEIANHSWSHPDFTTLSYAGQQSELRRCQQQLDKLGVKARWFRPPYGAFNRGVVKCVAGEGLRPVLWSVDPQDWMSPGAGKIESRVLAGSGNGAVILLHSTNAQTVEALPRIIERLRERGFTFLTMTQWEQAATGKTPAVSGNGVPPSLRQVTPGKVLPLPDVPAPPSGGIGLLASSRVDNPVGQAEPTEVEQVKADPTWVRAVEQDLGVMAATAEGAAVTMAAAGDAAKSTAAAADSAPLQVVPELPALQLGPALQVIGNFELTQEARGIFAGGKGKRYRSSEPQP
jgi:peptidoglycan/xylan/chitin deacetylase (PgdA/CDA1 family)